MKPVLIVYATREGHTQKIAEHLAETLLRRGVFVELGNAAQLTADFDLFGCYGSVIALASVHAGRHEPELIEFVKHHRSNLGRLPNAFLSVSLSQATTQLAEPTRRQKERAAARIEAALERFREQTGWTPATTLSVAGALPYLRYKRPLRFVMRWLARATGLPADTSRDYAWTDWPSLDRFATAFAKRLRELEAGPAPIGAR